MSSFDPLQVCADVHVPQLATVREVPQLSAAVTVPHVLLSREQNAVFVSALQPHWFVAAEVGPGRQTLGPSSPLL